MNNFKRSYLIQRLLKPYENQEGILRDNPFSFGGGLKNGGLSDEAMDMIRSIFRFDYMGAAEFEWGAVPKALSKIANNVNDLVTKTITHNNKNIYILCKKDQVEPVVDFVSAKASDEWGKNSPMTKERVGLSANLKGEKYSDKNVGWLELDNGYFFFTDKNMFNDTCKLFGVK